MSVRGYNTRGKTLIFEIFKSNPSCQFTTEQIIDKINEESGEKIAKSSVYRIIGRLCEDGTLRRFRDDSDSNYLYQYTGGSCECKDHFHMKCTGCGMVFHLHCADVEVWRSHITDEHGFLIDCGKSVLYGVCEKCSK